MAPKSDLSSRNSPNLSPVAARYLEVIHYVVHEGQVPRPSRLAEWMGVSAPTVTGILSRLRAQALVEVTPDRVPRLTSAGETEAAAIVRRHRVVERWLCDELGLDWAAADEEAGRISHQFSDQVVDRIFERLGRPPTCPHGNEIPGAQALTRRLVSLAELDEGQVAPISRISEVAEHEAPQLLTLLAREGLTMGEPVEVRRDLGAEAVVVLHRGHQTALGMRAAVAVWVDLSRAQGDRRDGASPAGTPRTRPR